MNKDQDFLINLVLRGEEDVLEKSDYEYIEYFIKLMKGYISFEIDIKNNFVMKNSKDEFIHPDDFVYFLQISLYEKIGKGFLLEKQYNFHELHQQFIKKYPKLFTMAGECVVGGMNGYGYDNNGTALGPSDNQGIQREVLKLINHILLNKEIITDIFYRRETMGSRERHRYIHKANGMLGEFRYKFKKEKDIFEFRKQIHRYLQFKKRMEYNKGRRLLRPEQRLFGELLAANICD